MRLHDVHAAGAWVVVVANAAVGLWALAAMRAPALHRPALWWATAAAQLSLFAQVALGVALVAAEDQPTPRLHAFYGFVGIATVGILYSYRAQLRERLLLLYGAGGLFLMGLGLRALFLGAR